jgi:DNA-binding transcriptional LysR family regulator
MNTTLLPDLATFVLIVDQGSFSAAARISGATPSAMSRCVSRLEQAWAINYCTAQRENCG